MWKALLVICCVTTLTIGSSTPIYGYSGLAVHHCKNFDVESVWRLATGRLSEIHGPRFKEYDAYIRSFVGYGMSKR